VNLKYQLALLTMMLSLVMTASAQEGFLTYFSLPPLAALQIQAGDVDSRHCDRKIVSDLKFVINDQVVGEELLLNPPTYYVGDYLEVKLQEDLRICNRYYTVDLWIAIEMPDGTRLFLVPSRLGIFPHFSLSPAPFKTDLHSNTKAHSVLSFEIPPDIGGEYYFYAAYTRSGKDISDLLFTSRSNRAAVKVIDDIDDWCIIC
jgi:hypothetical protein